jgi:hypothetical protein
MQKLELITEEKIGVGLYWIDPNGKLFKVKGNSHDKFLLAKPEFKGMDILKMYNKAFGEGWIRARLDGAEFNGQFHYKTVSNNALKKMVDVVFENRKKIKSIYIQTKDRDMNLSNGREGVEQFFTVYERWM